MPGADEDKDTCPCCVRGGVLAIVLQEVFELTTKGDDGMVPCGWNARSSTQSISLTALRPCFPSLPLLASCWRLSGSVDLPSSVSRLPLFRKESCWRLGFFRWQRDESLHGQRRRIHWRCFPRRAVQHISPFGRRCISLATQRKRWRGPAGMHVSY